jgi:hypothetical protein
MAISASAAVQSNTGAVTPVEGVIFLRGSTTGATGEIEEQQPSWSGTSLGSMSWNACRFPQFTTANGFSTNLDAQVDVFDDAKFWDMPVLPDEAGTLDATFTCLDEDASSDTATTSATITDASTYTQLYVDDSASNTEGEIYQTDFTDSASTSIDAIDPDKNLYQRDWTVRKGTLATDGSGALEAVTQDGVGMSIATLDYGVEQVVLESTVRFTAAGETVANGFCLRYGGGISWLIVGLNEDGDKVQIVNRTGFSVLAESAFTVAANTDYVLKVTDDGSEINVYVDGNLELTHTTSTYSGNTECGINGWGVGGSDSGEFIWKDFSFKILNDGSGESGDAISNIDTMATLMDAVLDKVLVNVAPGTYHQTKSLPVDGVNVVWRWGTSGTLVNLDTDQLDRETPVFEFNGGSGTLRRCTFRGFNVQASNAVTAVVDFSDSAVCDTGSDTIVVSSELYDAASDDDPIYYAATLSSSTNLPGGLTQDEVYYVSKQGSNTIKLLATPGGSVVNITSLSNHAGHVLVLNGRKKLVNAPSGVNVDMCFADIELDESTPDYAFEGFGGTMADGSRLAYLRVKANGVATVRGWISCFVSTSTHTVDLACIDSDAGAVTTERPHRFNLGLGRLTFGHNHVNQSSHGGKNPLRVQACERASIFGCNLVGTSMSIGGDGGNAQHVRVEQCHINGIDAYDAGEVQVVSCIISDEKMLPVTGNTPTGAQYPGGMGLNRDSTASGRFYIGHCTIVATGEALAETNNVFGTIEGTSDANVEANVLIEGCVFTFDGNTAPNAYGFMHLYASVSSSIFTNNTVPEDSETEGEAAVVGRIDGVNQSEAQWTSNAATSGTTYASVTLDSSFVPTGGGTATVPNGVFGDAFGSPWTPGQTQNRGGVDEDSTPPTVAQLSPADNATGVPTATTPDMQFSENMKVGTGTIELRQVSDDSVLDSINAADATINIGDRTEVTLTGLSLLGQSGAVYIYIPMGAFLSQSTSLPFAGYTANTDWNFTIGSVGTSGNRSRIRDGLRQR